MDVTIIGHLPNKQKHPTSLTEASTNHTNHHLRMEAKKYNRINQKINNTITSEENIMNEINKENIILKAFTVDRFGALGPQANNYFFNIKNTTTIKNDKIISRFTKPGLTLNKRNKEDQKFKNLFK